MQGQDLCDTMLAVLGGDDLVSVARAYGVIERKRACDITRFVLALIASGGTHEAGRQFEVLARYVDSGAPKVVRASFYDWFDEPLERMMTSLLARAMAHVRSLSIVLPPSIAFVRDWRIVDSTTVRLVDSEALLAEYPGTGEYAAVKLHKTYSLGWGNLTDYHFSPAREHDSPHLVIDESWRGFGLIADLGYASMGRLADCDEFGVPYVIRLKDDWTATVEHVTHGLVAGEHTQESDFPFEFERGILQPQDGIIDADVVLGRDGQHVRARLVGIEAPGHGLCLYLTNISRETCGAALVGDIYRLRWEIEVDNKVDKMGARLDEIAAKKPTSVRILLLASLLNTTIARIIVHRERAAIRAMMIEEELDECPRPPLHPIAVVRAMRVITPHLERLLVDVTPDPIDWNDALARIRQLGHDPNWRRKPSLLDRMLGLTAPPGRPRKQKTSVVREEYSLTDQ